MRRERMREQDAGVGEQPAPVARMMAALARVDAQSRSSCAARAEEDGRPFGARRGPSEAMSTSAPTGLAVLAHISRSPGEPISSPISIRYLALKPRRPRVRSTWPAPQVDRVLALVVGDAAAVPAAVALGQLPGRQARLSTPAQVRGSRRHGRSRTPSAGPGPRCARPTGTAPAPWGVSASGTQNPWLERRAHLALEIIGAVPRSRCGFWLSVGIATRRARSARNAPESNCCWACAMACMRHGGCPQLAPSSGRRCRHAPARRVIAVEAERHPRLLAADQFGHRLARARAVRPAQRAVAGVHPQPAHLVRPM